jgi:cytidine deaminase
MKTISSDKLNTDQHNLIEAAIAATDTAYVPYSGYHVGAAVLTRSGSVFAASNVENVAYGPTVCAERMAIGKANSSGARDIVAIAISSRSANFEKTEVACGPCGSCRQVIYEMAQVSGCDIEVIGSTIDKGHIAVSTIEQLLPLRKKKYESVNLISSDKLNADQHNLIEAAIAATDTAYNPYSGYYVGAAILTRSGSVFAASNVENAAYGSTICAERMAVGKANSSGARDIVAIAITSRSDNFEKNEITSDPCGTCRQVIYEMAQVSGCNIEVIISDTNKDNITIKSIEQLLPYAFGPSQLHIDVVKGNL